MSEAGDRSGGASTRSGTRAASAWWWAVLAGTMLVQLVVLYAPSGPGAGPFPHSDKVVHVGVFFVPVLVALVAGVARWLVVAVFAAHAVVSEVVQGGVLPSRSGEPWDVVADLAGVALGLVVWVVVERLRSAPTTVSGEPRLRW